jgi:hypothetical protein
LRRLDGGVSLSYTLFVVYSDNIPSLPHLWLLRRHWCYCHLPLCG